MLALAACCYDARARPGVHHSSAFARARARACQPLAAMGKRHFKGNNSSNDKKRRREAADKWKNQRGDDRDNQWTTVTENKRMEAFYKAQHFIHGDEDWNAFTTALRTTLPATFRINPGYTFAEELKAEVKGFMGSNLNIDGVEIKAIETLSWYPNGNAYKLGTDRRSIRKLESLSHLHKWMIQHTDNGNITRQEAVSMVPPLALDVKPHHKCLDMCASPGSKTSQLLEIVNNSLGQPESEQGLVVANDVDTDRAYMLVHQCKRLNSPLLVITTHAGQAFPPIRGDDGQTKSEFFDRVLCDVPCSGDGTLRKNPMIWGKWCTAMAMSLHTLQISIAKRGLQLLKAGGIMVYSTCSMSPYEDEAVVAELLRTHAGKLELVDARQFLPLFKTRAGLSSWHVLDDYHSAKMEVRARKAVAKKGATPDTAAAQEGDVAAEDSAEMDTAAPVAAPADASEDPAAEVPPAQPQDFSHITDPELRACLEMGMQYFPTAADVPSHLDWKVKSSYFAPSEEEKQWMHLERCLRCVPQDEDSGGFFVAALRKIEVPREEAVPKVAVEIHEPTAESTADVAATEVAAPEASAEDTEDVVVEEKQGGIGGKAKMSQRGLVEFAPWDVATFDKIRAFYDFDAGVTNESFYIREDQVNKNRKVSATGSKTIYYMPKSVRALIEGDYKKQLKIVTAGIKAFEKKLNQTTGESEYRLLQDSVQVLAPHIHARKIKVTAQDFSNILGGGLVSFVTLSAQTIQQLYALPMGMVLCVYEYSNADAIVPEGATDFVAKDAPHSFLAVCWKGVSKTMNVMCGKIDIEHMKHQMAALNVLRPKILPPKREVDGKDSAEAAQEQADAALAAEMVAEDDAVVEAPADIADDEETA